MPGLDWEKDEHNDVIYAPYVGHRTATLNDKICLIRLAFVTDPQQREAEAPGLQLALSRDQLRKLGHDLLRLAEVPHIPAPPTSSRN